jgi:hypothetical protein
MINKKVEGQEVTVGRAGGATRAGDRPDDALKESLAKRGLSPEDAAAKKPPAKTGAAPAAKSKAAEAPKKRAQGGRK